VGLFLVDEAQRFAVLRAGTGDAGQQMLARAHRLQIGGDSMIGRCVANGQAAIALDVADKGRRGDEPHRFDNPLLPETRSEMALPLRSRGRVVGAMTVQDSVEAAFDDSDIAVMQTMADQVAVAIDNARLFAEVEAALEEMEATHRRYLGQAWAEYTASRSESGYALTEAGLQALGAEHQISITEGTESGDGLDGQTGSAPPAQWDRVIVPIKQLDQSIGVLGVQEPRDGRQWTAEEIALVESIAEQFALAADNLRLLEETQRRAAQEQLIADATARMRESLDIETVLRTTASEMRQALDLDNLVVYLASPETGGDYQSA
jgi:GAF domain-containing protein